MLVKWEGVYDADLETTMAMLLDRDFRLRVCAAQSLVSYDVQVAAEGAQTTVSIDKQQAPDGIPKFALKFVGGAIQLVQRERWEGQDMTFDLLIPGKPGQGRGAVAVTAEGTQTREVVELDITVDVPLVGNKIAGVIGDQFVAAMEAEFVVGQAWLAERA